jgi:flagellar biosynthesis GTPase FlhF
MTLKNDFMGVRRSRARRKPPPERKRPFFDKQNSEQPTFFSANSIQRKLNVSKPGDPAEKEADSAAKNVMQVQKAEKKEEEKPVQKADKKEEEKPVQKEEKKEDEKVSKAEKKEEEKPVQKAEKKEEEKPVQKAEKKEEEKPVQKADKKEEDKPVQKADKEEEAPVQAKTDPRIQKAAMGDDVEMQDDAAPSFESLLSKRKGMGFALPDELRRDMEGKFRTSFKDVRIHTDKEAGEMCEAIHALAFAHGHDIYFNEGMYNPEALSGRELLAHELAHIVQQNG